MKKITLIHFTIFLFCLQLVAQKHDYHWMMGNGDPHFNLKEGVLFNFNESPMNMMWLERDMEMTATTATMSDANGNLIFYSNGCEIFNAEHELMENGDSLNSGYVYDYQCLSTTGAGLNSYTVPQGMLVLPIPGDASNIYYIFHNRIIYLYNLPTRVYADRILCTKVDMTEDGGKGAVIEKNTTVLEDTLTRGQLSAVRHANGIDWWILQFRETSDTCYTLLLTSDSIYGPFIQEVGLPTSKGTGTLGEACFSPDGTKYVRSTWKNHVYLYDFDRETGLLSNFQHIKLQDTLYPSPIKVAISPNSQYLYASYEAQYIYQFDLWEEDIQASKLLVSELILINGYWGAYFGKMELAPDCRIYIISENGTQYIHIIDSPDERGEACNVLQYVNLPLYYDGNFRSIPYFPNYRLGVTPTYPCDSTIALDVSSLSVVIDDLEGESISVELSPNPVERGANMQVILKGIRLFTDRKEYRVYDVFGRVVLEGYWEAGQRSHHLQMPQNLGTGVYFLVVECDGKQLPYSFVVR